MNWLKDLPLEKISEALAGFFAWWANVTDSIPAAQLPLTVYVVGCVLVLALWWLIARLFPRPFKGISWVMVAAILFAPGQAAGGGGEVAPAMLGVFHAILMKDFAGAVVAFLPILAVFAALLVVGAIWQMLRSVIANTTEKQAETARIQEQKRQMNQNQSQA